MTIFSKDLLDLSAAFLSRHIAPSHDDQTAMLQVLGLKSTLDLIKAVVPTSILEVENLDFEEFQIALPEHEALAKLQQITDQNILHKSFIGQGYYNTLTPSVIQRNILENPAWYTAYTPYQPEISQGRLEAIVNFQQVVIDLTGMDIANASMLDEGTAAAEAMTLASRSNHNASKVFFVARDIFPQTIAVLQTRAKPLGIQVVIDDPSNIHLYNMFGAIIQYPSANGQLRTLSEYLEMAGAVHHQKALFIVASDLLALTVLNSPKHFNADIVVGNSQRFGVPLGFGGPHAAFLATKDLYKRNMPGRLVGVSIDQAGNPAYRLALQTREQHIRREKATSNICTAQVLLAVIAGMYAVYHGPEGLKRIANRVHYLTCILADGLKRNGVHLKNNSWFDTLEVQVLDAQHVSSLASSEKICFRLIDQHHVGISLDESTTKDDVFRILRIFNCPDESLLWDQGYEQEQHAIPPCLQREEPFLTHPTFNQYHAEHEMLRYIRRLSDKDLALDRTMIPLGSCTMKLNATSEMLPISWPNINQIHPFAPPKHWQGYAVLIEQLEKMLCAATGYSAVSLQPNAGSQGEYAGLLVIRAYHASRNESHRNICLIPSSAHGTNPASAQMAGMDVVVVGCDLNGNIDMADLRIKAEQFSETLAAIMITYPSTHGVFESTVSDICNLIHLHGGQVYIDGANMNALVGTAAPGHFGGDVSHLNLHKTFCIPHGGGGPGVGPVAVRAHLAEFLPFSYTAKTVDFQRTDLPRISSAPFGSASILPISWMYIAMMGAHGLKTATEVAILSANYLAQKLSSFYPILYTGQNGLVAHECILDIRPIQKSSGITNEDIAKRLIDYGFHAPTMSFPVSGTLMLEPTESESKAELDRFIEAMVSIREEIDKVISGEFDAMDNPLKNAPHTSRMLSSDIWKHSYSRQVAGFPVSRLHQNKYWPPVNRIDNVFGDRNLFCACIPVDEYALSKESV